MRIAPLTPKTWPDFESLMGPKGGVGGCWCMLWRQTRREHDAGLGEANKETMRRLAEATPPGLLAYDEERAVGWISVAPRSSFRRLETSRVLKPVDAHPVWSISCFLVVRSHRRRGIAIVLLEAACDFVREAGGEVVEGYPVEPSKDTYPAAYAWTGFVGVFLKAGFREVARRSETRPIMRKRLVASSKDRSR